MQLINGSQQPELRQTLTGQSGFRQALLAWDAVQSLEDPDQTGR